MAKSRPAHIDDLEVPPFLRSSGPKPEAPPHVSAAQSKRDDVAPVQRGAEVRLDGLHFQRVFYTGMSVVRPGSPLRYDVSDSDCPTFGQSSAFVLHPNQEGKRKKTGRLILFDPFSLKANQVTPEAGELVHHVEMRKVTTKIEGGQTVTEVPFPVQFEPELLDQSRIDRLAEIITQKWHQCCELNMAGDFDVAAVVLQRLGKPVPAVRPAVRVDKATGEAKRSGKDAGPALLKALVATSKRGKVYEYFAQGGRTVMEAMGEFGATRSGILTNLHGLNADCGIGYSIVGDVVTMQLPTDCTDPFDTDQAGDPLGGGDETDETRGADLAGPDDQEGVRPPRPTGKSGMGKGQKDGSPASKGKGKPLLEKVTALPERGKRREVALACYREAVSLVDVATQIGASEASVRSHLNDLHTKHGFGYEVVDGQARLLTPKGWKP